MRAWTTIPSLRSITGMTSMIECPDNKAGSYKENIGVYCNNFICELT
jgi:hypothetical protein